MTPAKTPDTPDTNQVTEAPASGEIATAPLQSLMPPLSSILSLASLSGLIYASGFLIIYEFHESYALRDLDSELFRIKYAYA